MRILHKKKKLSIYDKMTNLVNSYDIPQNVKQLLIVYFDKMD